MRLQLIIILSIFATVLGNCPTDEELEEQRKTGLESSLRIIYEDANGKITAFNLTEPKALADESFLDPDQDVYFFIHDYKESGIGKNYKIIKEALFDKGKTNFFILDTSEFLHLNYLDTFPYIFYIGERLGQYLDALDRNGIIHSRITLIGYGLGAHVAGVAGKTFREIGRHLINRIIGLDPAGPCFDGIGRDKKLQPTDAKFVDVIYASEASAEAEYLGQVNFFPNGGHIQPGCRSNACFHRRPLLYLGESIRREAAFPALPCESYEDFQLGKCGQKINYMGFAAKMGSNKYYLRTADRSPFGLNIEGIQPLPRSSSQSQSKLVSQSKPQLQPKLKSQPEPQFQSKLESQPEPQDQPKLESQPEPQDQPKLESQPETQPQPQLESQSEPQPRPNLESESEPRPQSNIEPESEPQPQPNLESQSELQPQPQLESQPETQPQPQLESQPETQPQPNIESQSEPQPQPNLESESEPQPNLESQPEPQSQPKLESQPELQPQPKLESKSEFQSQSSLLRQYQSIPQIAPPVLSQAHSGIQLQSQFQLQPSSNITEVNKHSLKYKFLCIFTDCPVLRFVFKIWEHI